MGESTQLEQLSRAWAAIEERSALQQEVMTETWSRELQNLSRLQEELRTSGRWISGPRDLMGVLDVAFDEVRHCRVLRWLLDPSGGHGMGQRFLREFAIDIGRRTPAPLDVDSIESV